MRRVRINTWKNHLSPRTNIPHTQPQTFFTKLPNKVSNKGHFLLLLSLLSGQRKKQCSGWSIRLETCSTPPIPPRHHLFNLGHPPTPVGPSANVCEPLKRQCECHSWAAIVPLASGSHPGYRPGTPDQSFLGLF